MSENSQGYSAYAHTCGMRNSGLRGIEEELYQDDEDHEDGMAKYLQPRKEVKNVMIKFNTFKTSELLGDLTSLPSKEAKPNKAEPIIKHEEIPESKEKKIDHEQEDTDVGNKKKRKTKEELPSVPTFASNTPNKSSNSKQSPKKSAAGRKKRN